jgi:Mrp family chromosome partitioning ATPase
VHAADVDVSEAEEQAFAQTFFQQEQEAPAGHATQAALRGARQSTPLMTSDIVSRLHDTHEPGQAVRVLVTSPAGGTSARETAIDIAEALSEKGRAIVVAVAHDLDSLTGGSGEEAAPRLGLGDLLSGDASFAEVIHRPEGSRVHFIPCGHEPYSSLDGFDLVLDALCHTYDFIVLAANDVGDTSEALALAPQVNLVMLATGGASSDEAATKAYGDLVDAGARDVLLVGRETPPEKSAA